MRKPNARDSSVSISARGRAFEVQQVFVLADEIIRLAGDRRLEKHLIIGIAAEGGAVVNISHYLALLTEKGKQLGGVGFRQAVFSAQLGAGEYVLQFFEQGLAGDEGKAPCGEGLNDTPRRRRVTEKRAQADVGVKDDAHGAPAAPAWPLRSPR